MTEETVLTEIVQRWAREAPSRLAVTAGRHELDYRRLHEAMTVAAYDLRAHGVESGDRVLLVGHNTWQWVVAYLAVLRLGAIVVPLNNRLSPRQVSELARVTAPRLFLADSAHSNLLAECQGVRCLGLDENGCSRWLSPGTSDANLPPMPQLRDPAVISFTSGTTGTPKGAVLSQAALSASSRIICEAIGLASGSSTLVLAPLFHNIGFIDQLGSMLYAGGRCDLLSVFHTGDAIAAFRQRPVSYVTAVPSVLRLLMTAEDADAAYASAETVLFGGSPMPAAWSRELLTRWPHLKLRHGYGLTEFGSACAILPSQFIEEYGESVGYPPTGVRLRIVGEDGRDVRPGEVGEIWVAGPTLMTEYWQQPAATAERIRGEWLRTGDLARFGEHDLIFIVGRSDDTINRGGEKILPQFVESALAERPDVAQCIVFGVPHPVLQQSVIAAVEPRSGLKFDRDAAIAHLRTRIPDYAIPEDYMLDTALPRTGSGKIDRRAARALYLARMPTAGCARRHV
jgi:long-chain acyl-CoA synthetase